jgi:TRAP-type C4-dicarboxylate transport system substrate-binding protein
MGQGLLEGTILRCAKAAGQVPVLNLGDLPFLQDTEEQAEDVAKAVAPIYAEALEPFGVEVAAVWKSAPTGVTCKVNVDTLEAWQGITLRAWSPTLVDLSNLLGVKPVQMPYSEAFSGLATGIIDGVYWTPSAAVSEHTYDAGCMYYDQWNIFTMTNAAVFGKPALDNISSEARDIVMEVFEEFEHEVWRDEYWSFENDYAELRTHGVTIVAVNPAEIAKVRNKTSVVWDKWLDVAGDDGLKALNKTLNALGRPDYR